MELRDLVHQVEFKRDQLGLKLKRRTFFAAKLHAELAKVREDRRLYQCRKQTLDENRLKAEAEMQRKEVDLDDVTRKLLTRTSNSPTVFDQLTAVIESLRCDIWSLEAKLETMDTQARSLNRDQHTLQKYIDCLNGELDGSFKVWTYTTDTQATLSCALYLFYVSLAPLVSVAGFTLLHTADVNPGKTFQFI